MTYANHLWNDPWAEGADAYFTGEPLEANVYDQRTQEADFNGWEGGWLEQDALDNDEETDEDL